MVKGSRGIGLAVPQNDGSMMVRNRKTLPLKSWESNPCNSALIRVIFPNSKAPAPFFQIGDDGVEYRGQKVNDGIILFRGR